MVRKSQIGLIADIGATNARFALVDDKNIFDEQVLSCADHDTLVSAARAYLDIVRPLALPKMASFAIAGPIKDDWFTMTNHPWSFSIAQTKDDLNLNYFRLVNDFEAVGMAIPHLRDKDMRRLGEGSVIEHAPIGILGPGTGLGVGYLVWSGDRYLPIPCEGGHVTMPARTQRQYDIFEYLRAHKYSHVSAERVCSGKGLVNIYDALRGLDKRDDLPERSPQEISEAAVSGACDICKEALDLMMEFLGVVAGNLALSLGAFGGIYIAGGIVQKLGDYIDNSKFRESFLAKGRFEDYMAAIPTFVIENEYPAFIGLHADLLDHHLAPGGRQRQAI